MQNQHPGSRIAAIRKSRGWTQERLAREADVDKFRLSKIENGKFSPSSTWVGAVANALGVEADLLNGASEEAPRLDGSAPIVRRVLASTDALPVNVPESLDELRIQVQQVGKWRHAAAYKKITDVLPNLVNQLLVAGERDGAPAYAMLSSLYRAANTLSHKLGHYDLSTLATDRMIWAASKSEDPLLLATTHYVKSAALARIGESARAVLLTDRTIADVEPFADDPTGAAVLCALHMRRAGLATLAGDGDVTDTHYGEARDLGQRVGDKQVMGTIVGPVNVALFELASAIDLGRNGKAKKITTTLEMPSDYFRERQAHLHLDRARWYLAEGKPDDAVDALQEARWCAPEYFRNSRAVKLAILSAAERQRRATSGLRALANYAGLPD